MTTRLPSGDISRKLAMRVKFQGERFGLEI